ncbi:sucrose phosphorylase [Malonomonas rubra DSM 5091]|uniref:Sucrose phosphorylase n=1 Tax=Malonomonas rubra DSM 5091 TaxID=1122189 RepID=A0A1M6I1X4_MALRU|nr:sugar phosphorylase [Malonomonas rubra]SHJ28438.1 sucrose phosphorylase [Malonomonas rubra DSM 5091]
MQQADYLEAFKTTAAQRIKRIYPAEQAKRFLSQLFQELEEGLPASQQEHHCRLWSEQDIILISYGDSLCSEQCSPLQTLCTFLEQHLRGLISVVHLLPFFPYSSDDGFAVIDYLQVNPELGDWSQVAEINRNFDLMVDLVINHISSQHRWFQQFLRNEQPGKDYFISPPESAELQYVVRPRQSPLLTDVETDSGPAKVWTTFSADQVDVDFSNPDVLLEYIRILLFYLQQGARFIRLDAVAFLWKEWGTSCLNLPQTHEIVKLLRDFLGVVAPKTVLLTETNLPHQQNISYFGDSDEAHMIYQFSLAPLLLHGLFRGTSHYLCDWARTRCSAPPGCTFLNFTASHDGVGMRPLEGLLPQGEIDLLLQGMEKFGGMVSYKANTDGSKSPYEINISYFDALKGTWMGDDCWQIARFLLAQTLMMGLRGIPAVYIHSLLATANDHEGVEQTGRARSINRRRWQQKVLAELLGDTDSDQSIVFSELKRRLAIRREQPAFHPDARQEILHLGEYLFGFWRTSLDGKQRVFAVHNLTDQVRKLYLDGALDGQFEGRWVGLLTGEVVTAERAVVELPPYHVLWLAQESS